LFEDEEEMSDHCRFCKPSTQERDHCDHVNPNELEVSYGFAMVSNWEGIGINYRCPKCSECLYFEDDYDCTVSKEQEHKNKRREEMKQWNPHGAKP